MKSMMNS